MDDLYASSKRGGGNVKSEIDYVVNDDIQHNIVFNKKNEEKKIRKANVNRKKLYIA